MPINTQHCSNLAQKADPIWVPMAPHAMGTPVSELLEMWKRYSDVLYLGTASAETLEAALVPHSVGTAEANRSQSSEHC